MNKKILFVILASICILSGCKSKKVEAPHELTPLEMLKLGKKSDAKNAFVPKADINAIDEDGNTLLHLAAQINDGELCAFFILKGADTEVVNKEGDTPLHVAIKSNAYYAAKSITAAGGNLFAKNAEEITAIDAGLTASAAYYDILITEKTGKILDENGQNLVHYFVNTKNLKGIKQCKKKNLPLSIRDINGNTPLDLAFTDLENQESVYIAAELITGGADEVAENNFAYFQEAVASRNVNTRFEDGQTPLHLSSIYGHSAIAKYLLETGAETSVQDSAGATPLHESIRYGHIDIAQMLLDSGANVNAKDNLGKTPIMLILPKEKIEQAYSLLIKYRADLNEKDMYGDTVLHTAAMLHVNANIIETLTNGGADINARNKEGVTPLEIAIQQKDVETVRLLTSCGASIHTQDTNGNSPLTLALAGDASLFEATVNRLNANTQDSSGNTPLHIALEKDAPLSKIQYIISLTDDVNIRNSEGNSALFITALKNRKQVGELLLAKNADIFSTNVNNNSPLRLALKYPAVQNWMITSKTIRSTDGSGNTVLHYAAEWQYSDSITTLITKGADINARNANGETCLFNAAKTNNPDVIQAIIDAGASIKDRDNLGSTPLHTAVRWDAEKSAEKLISLGININSQNSSGKSPLAESTLAGKYKVSKYLLEHGADANSSDAEGVTILMYTIRGGNKQLVKLLLENGANPNLQAINGKNSYHEAAYTGNIEIIRLIRKAGGNPLSRDKQGNTPFSIVINSDIAIINEVLGTSTNITDSDGNSPIHIVIKSNASDSLLKTLIANGYSIDTRNSDGYTPLNYAINQGKLNSAIILLENGANPFISIDKKGTNGVTMALDRNDKQLISNIVKYASGLSDIQGNTILHYAAKTSSIETVRYLLSFGIETNIKNVSGDTPYQIAVRWKRQDVAALLKTDKDNAVK